MSKIREDRLQISAMELFDLVKKLCAVTNEDDWEKNSFARAEIDKIDCGMSTPTQIVEWKKTILASIPNTDIAARLALSCLLQEIVKQNEHLINLTRELAK